ncbi:hypothetical protein RB653_005967 [Dictyostelium firmibasis]|uniref:Pesticidal crystal protein domain-containing protein n=1 Tax=Dictyostelium firmibasis TaxID=79012 RepID=A0AAN7U901_9MYCE
MSETNILDLTNLPEPIPYVEYTPKPKTSNDELDDTVDEEVELIDLGLSLIPEAGEVLKYGFHKLWGSLYKKQEKYLTIEDFYKRIEAFRKETEKMVKKQLAQEYIKTCENLFKTLKNSCDDYDKFVNELCKFKGANDEKEKIKEEVRTQYLIVINNMNQCFNFFLDGDCLKDNALLGNYVQAMTYYVLVQSDVGRHGESDFGMSKSIVSDVKKRFASDLIKAYKVISHFYEHSEAFYITDCPLTQMISRWYYFDFGQFPNLKTTHVNAIRKDSKTVLNIPTGKGYDNSMVYPFNLGMMPDLVNFNFDYIVGCQPLYHKEGKLVQFTLSRVGNSFKKVTFQYRNFFKGHFSYASVDGQKKIIAEHDIITDTSEYGIQWKVASQIATVSFDLPSPKESVVVELMDGYMGGTVSFE